MMKLANKLFASDKQTSTAHVVLVFWFVFISLLCILSAIYLFMPAFSQSVTQVKIADQTCYFTSPEFMLRWQHSVEKQWWEENYHRRESDFLLTTTYFQSFGAGTPSTETYAPIQKKGYVGYQIDEAIPVLHWVVSRLTMGELSYQTNEDNQHKIPIHLWAEDYSEVTITPARYNRLQLLTKDKCHEHQY